MKKKIKKTDLKDFEKKGNIRKERKHSKRKETFEKKGNA